MNSDGVYLDFLAAMGDSFSEKVSPPIPLAEASPHECCEAIWSLLGEDVTPEVLASLDRVQIAQLAEAFGRYFETSAPSAEQIRASIEVTLFRWPVGSLP